jgi:hypothetical protein
MVTDFGYPRACRFRKYQIEKLVVGAPSTNFCQNVNFYLKNVAKIGKHCAKIGKN